MSILESFHIIYSSSVYSNCEVWCYNVSTLSVAAVVFAASGVSQDGAASHNWHWIQSCLPRLFGHPGWRARMSYNLTHNCEPEEIESGLFQGYLRESECTEFKSSISHMHIYIQILLGGRFKIVKIGAFLFGAFSIFIVALKKEENKKRLPYITLYFTTPPQKKNL